MARTQYRSATVLSFAGSLSTGLALFLLFRTGVATSGSDAVGLWALVQGLFLFTRVADSGVGVNLTRLIALDAKERARSVWRYVSCGLISGTLPVTALSVAMAPLVGAFVRSRAPEAMDDRDVTVLVLASLIFAVASSIASILGSVCDGARLIPHRNAVVVLSCGVAVVVSEIWQRQFGITGLGAAYCCMAAVQVAGIVLILLIKQPRRTRVVQSDAFLPFLRQTAMEGLPLMGAAATRLSFEPLCKLFLALLAPLSFVAAFDLALKISTQARALLQSALQPLVAFSARSRGRSPTHEDQLLYRGVDAGTIAIVWAAAQCLIVASPALAIIAFGSLDGNFVTANLVLTVATAVNSVGLTGYFLLMSEGAYDALLRIQLVMAVINAVGCVGGFLMSSPWIVVASYAIAMGFGGWRMRWIFSTTLQTVGRWSLMPSRLDLGILAGALILALSSSVLGPEAVLILLLSVAAAFIAGLRLAVSWRKSRRMVA